MPEIKPITVRPPSRPVAARIVAAGPRKQLEERPGLERVAGISPVGMAVNATVLASANGTTPRNVVFSKGAIEEVLISDPDPESNEMVDKMIAMIKEAKHEVRIQTFVWHTHEAPGQRLLAALAAKQRENPSFKVYISYDRERAWGLLANRIREAGVRAETASYTGLLSRSSNHSKAVIVDGHTALLGSFNIERMPMSDLAVVVRGPIVQAMLDDFDHAWARSWLWTKPDGGVTLRRPPLPPRPPLADAPAPTRALVPMTWLAKAGAGLDGMDPRHNDANRGLLAALNAAKKEIKLTSSNVNDWQVWEAIEKAARRGVKVKVMMPRGFNQTIAWIDRASNDRFPRLIAHLPPHLRDNLELRWTSHDGAQDVKSHVKYLSVDGQWAYVGSQNFDNQSFAFSREGGVGIDDAAQVRALDAQIFDGLWETSIRTGPRPGEEKLELPARSWAERLSSWLTRPMALISDFT